MARFFTIFLGLSIFIFMCSCASQKMVEKSPTPKFNNMVLAKNIDESSGLGKPLESTNEFEAQDQQVVSLITLDNIAGSHQIRWEWIAPDGTPYFSTTEYPLKVDNGQYLPKVTAWHRISLRNEPAADMPGKWCVNLFFDNEMLDTRTFIVKAFNDPLQLPSEVQSRPYPKDWGLIIGIENYNRLPEVDYARKDALVVRDYFTRILGVPEENIISLIDEDATKARIEGYLKKYIPQNVGKDATLYVYFAGHGMPGTKKGEPYLVPYDADTRFIEQTGYKLISFYQDLNQLGLKQIYVFLDSCFSGVASRAADMLVQGVRPVMFHKEMPRPATSSIISLSATSTGQMSNAFREKRHGLFTYYLLRGLKGEADMDDDGWTSIKEVYGYVHRNVSRESRRIQQEQTPVIIPPPDKLKDIGLTRTVIK